MHLAGWLYLGRAQDTDGTLQRQLFTVWTGDMEACSDRLLMFSAEGCAGWSSCPSHLHRGLGVRVCFPAYLPQRLNESQEYCGSRKGQLPAMREVNLASGNAWWFGKQQTRGWHVLCLEDEWGWGPSHPTLGSLFPTSAARAGKGEQNSLLPWVCLFVLLSWKGFQKTLTSLFFYLLLTQ